MSSQAAGMGPAFNQWPNQDAQGTSMGSTTEQTEDGVFVRPMRCRLYHIEGLQASG